MILPRNEKQLDSVFEKAELPEISGFSGAYFVDMLTGFPSLRVFSHRKVFFLKDGRIVGHNVMFKNFIWGHFFVEWSNAYFPRTVLINYDRPENSFFSNKIRDHIRCIEKGVLYLGRFNYLLMGRLRFWGYFTLEKEKTKADRD